MKRSALGLFAVALLLVVIGWSISSQVEELEPPIGYMRSDLQLISQESKATWSADWTGPIQAATMMAWFHEHGYSRLMQDFNGDGVIDELDTIELADIFGRGSMQAGLADGTDDARLVFGVAEYVAGLYPGEFVLKIYDLGFPNEFVAAGFPTFAPDAIPGIELALVNEPSLYAYEYELETAEGVIAGLEQRENGNTYLSGRSYIVEKTPEGYTPVDLAWSEENRFLTGHQGKVLETVAKEEDRLYLDYRFGWTPVEFMLALSPLVPPGLTSGHHDCPEDAIGYHVDTYDLDYGTIRIEECVTREGDFDTYSWTVSNISYVWNDCGLCRFAVASSGYTSVAHSGPGLWTFSEWPYAWEWQAPLGDCGIQVGEMATFSVTVPGPTVDIYVPAAVGACPSPPPPPNGVIRKLNGSTLELLPFHKIRTTGPGITGACCLPDGSCVDTDSPNCAAMSGDFHGNGTSCDTTRCPQEVDCPDLVVEFLERGTYCAQIGATAPAWEIHAVVRATNIGTATANSSFIKVVVSSPWGTQSGHVGPLDPGEFEDLSFQWTLGPNAPPQCSAELRAEVDALPERIDECCEDCEDNNEASTTINCPDCVR